MDAQNCLSLPIIAQLWGQVTINSCVTEWKYVFDWSLGWQCDQCKNNASRRCGTDRRVCQSSVIVTRQWTATICIAHTTLFDTNQYVSLLSIGASSLYFNATKSTLMSGFVHASVLANIARSFVPLPAHRHRSTRNIDRQTDRQTLESMRRKHGTTWNTAASERLVVCETLAKLQTIWGQMRSLKSNIFEQIESKRWKWEMHGRNWTYRVWTGTCWKL